MHRRVLLLAFGSAPMLAGQVAARPAPLIAAAASLQPALEEAAAMMAAQIGIAPRFAYGASGNLVRQIAQGAPFEMMIAADEVSIQKLAEAGQTRDAGHVFAVGRLALFAPRGSVLDPAAGLEALRPLLAAGRVQRFAIANPEIAPFGRAAEEALRSLNLWEALRPRLVFGENIAQAAQFAMTEGTIGGLVALSLMETAALKARGLAHIIECGPGKVLSGMVKRIDADLQSATVLDPASLQQTKELLA